MANPFASRKFIYAVTGVIMALVVAYLPALTAEIGLTLSDSQIETINGFLPWVLVLFGGAIGGHTLQDFASLWAGYQPNPKLRENIEVILDELLGDDDEPPVEVNVGGSTK